MSAINLPKFNNINREEILLISFCLICFFQSLIFTGCEVFSSCAYEAGGKEYKEFADFRTRMKMHGQELFSSYPVDKQIDIYLYAINCPNDSSISSLLTSDGEKKIPKIVSKIQEKEKSWDKLELIDALTKINEKCRCIPEDSDVIKELEQVESRFGNEQNVYEDAFRSKLKFLKFQLDNTKK